MNDSRPSSPDAPPQDLWSSILDSVSTSRSIPSKQVLVLGQPSSGKSTLVSALTQKPSADEGNGDKRSDFAVGYDWVDVRDDADEDTLARLSVYTVPAVAASYTALLPHFLPPRTCLPHTLVMIVLDWTRPWTFVEELQTWLEWVEKWAKGDRARELEIVREENRERLQSYLLHYTEPSAEPLPATSSSMSSTLLPLGPGTLTHNTAGVPVIVACTKADLIDEGSDMIGAGNSGMGGMVKGKGGEWEERTDGVMQILRTICLKYGAGLFYTTPLPNTLQVLRQYALHTLFIPPAPTPGFGASEAPAPARNPFPFQHKPNTLDRDKIVVPAGWDSWGKISVMRDGFDAKSWGEAWERDIDYAEGETGEPGAKKMYSALVPDQGAKPPPLPPFNNPTPEQAFLAKNYDENSKKPTATRAARSAIPPRPSRRASSGPWEAARVAGASAGGDAAAARKLGRSSSGRPPASLTVPPAMAAMRANAPSPTPSSAGPSPTGGQTQHEVLQNFFQSLLSSKDRAGTGAGPGVPGAARTSPKANGNGSASGTDEGS
ncbi:dynein light intermediate chain-domain-containing protein [Amylocystis lapponica]|nr:dynein light intermediate chain-domain-containing protein [Amylocystis lapponica]